jgi:hypothetical protein
MRAVALRRELRRRGWKPTWAKLIDFETTLHTAIEELMQQQKERQRA